MSTSLRLVWHKFLCFIFHSSFLIAIFAPVNEQKRILVVDDEPDLCDILSFNLKQAGYNVRTAMSAEEALSSQPAQADLLLLDVMMPGMSGFELAHQLKTHLQTAHLPIIFLTAKDTEEDTLRGFGLGADDYIAKPFSVREVLARVKAVLHRTATSESAQLNYQGVQLDLNRKEVVVDGENVPFTRTEFELLSLLLGYPGEVFTRQQLIEQIWPKEVVVTGRTIDVNITRIRKKLGRYASCIATRVGYGYYFLIDN